jgi:hypothetical protein
MATETDTRSIEIHSADRIYLHGMTQGPVSGWEFDGRSLVHPTGNRVTFTSDAASRITAAIEAAIPTKRESLTGYQVSQLPEAERGGFEFSHVSDVHGIYIRTTPGTPSTVDIARADVESIGRR